MSIETKTYGMICSIGEDDVIAILAFSYACPQLTIRGK